MLERVEKLGVLERLQEFGADRVHAVAAVGEVVNQGIEPLLVHGRLALEALQRFDLSIELLEDVAAHVTAHEDCDDVEET